MVKNNFTRKDISNRIFKNLGFSKNMSSRIVDDILEAIVSELSYAKKIKISSFGSFEILDKKKRIGRNPKTKIETTISARKVVKFKPSKSFKQKINYND